MLRLNKGSKLAAKAEIEVSGQMIEIEIRPFGELDEVDFMQTYAKQKYILNPQTGRMQEMYRVEPSALKKIYSDRLDKVLINFWGVGDEAGNALDGTLLENKLLFAGVEVSAPVTVDKLQTCPECGAAHTISVETQARRTVYDLIMEKARSIAASQTVTAEERLKN